MTKLLPTLLVVTLMLIISSHFAFASVDLLAPVNNFNTSNNNVSFEYYVSMQNLIGCNVLVNGVSFADTNNQSNTMHSVAVSSIADGVYLWNVSCNNETDITASLNRNFTIDTVLPVITIVSPQQLQTYKTIPVDFIPYDDIDSVLSCSILWNNKSLDSINVARNTHYSNSYTSDPGLGLLQIMCADEAGNFVIQNRTMTL